MTEVMDLIRRLPTYMRLVWALLRDGRVPPQQKLILVGIGAYVVLPIDLAKISQDKDQLRRDIATAERLLGDRLDDVRDTVGKFRTPGRRTTGRKRGST